MCPKFCEVLLWTGKNAWLKQSWGHNSAYTYTLGGDFRRWENICIGSTTASVSEICLREIHFRFNIHRQRLLVLLRKNLGRFSYFKTDTRKHRTVIIGGDFASELRFYLLLSLRTFFYDRCYFERFFKWQHREVSIWRGKAVVTLVVNIYSCSLDSNNCTRVHVLHVTHINSFQRK